MHEVPVWLAILLTGVGTVAGFLVRFFHRPQNGRNGSNGGAVAMLTGARLGDIKGVLDGLGDAMRDAAAAQREIAAGNAANRAVMERLTHTLVAVEERWGKYQDAGRQSMQKVDAIYEATVKKRGRR